MTLERFNQIAKRFKIAFELSFDFAIGDLVIGSRKFDGRTIHFKTDYLEFSIGFYNDDPKWYFVIQNGTGFLSFTNLHGDIEFEGIANSDQFDLPLVHALYLLGIDTIPFETHFDLAISAHEKLEWQLEFARRMREETAG